MAPVLRFAGSDVSLHLSMPSLERIAALKVAITAWTRCDIRALIERCNFIVRSLMYDPKWDEIEKEVLKSVSQLALPERLKMKVSSFVKPIGGQIYKWKEFHEARCNKLNNEVGLPSKTSWTMHGTINKEQTAKALIEDHSVDIVTRFHFACAYCLEDYIKELWGEIIKQGKADCVLLPGNTIDWNKLLQFWCSVMRKGAAFYDTEPGILSYMFELVFFNGNETAVEYFLHKLSSAEKKRKLESIAIFDDQFWGSASGEYQNEVIFLIFSQMDAELQVNFLQHFSSYILLRLLSWPYQDLFLPAEVHLRDFHYHKYEAVFVLNKLMNKINDDFKDCDYPKLFMEFWRNFSKIAKRYRVIKCSNEDILFDLYLHGEKEVVRLILEEATYKIQKFIVEVQKHIGYDRLYNYRYCDQDYEYEKMQGLWYEYLGFLEGLIRDIQSKNVPESDDNLPSKLLCLRTNTNDKSL